MTERCSFMTATVASRPRPVLDDSDVLLDVGKAARNLTWADWRRAPGGWSRATGDVRSATLQILAWSSVTELAQIHVAVNISGRHVLSRQLPAHLREVLERTGVDPHRLSIEITETVLLTDLVVAAAELDSVRALGVKVAIDDFGTGYTSLSQLGQLPISTLKIDKSFVVDMIISPEHRAVVRSIVHLATSLGLKTVAEGVEDAVIAEALADLGCDYLQGYLITRALPIDQFDAWVELYRPTPRLGNRRPATPAAPATLAPR
jgi:EAL domain-containing protein (putative c-di-GMP-specific phosphodiesterase class I)